MEGGDGEEEWRVGGEVETEGGGVGVGEGEDEISISGVAKDLKQAQDVVDVRGHAVIAQSGEPYIVVACDEVNFN